MLTSSYPKYPGETTAPFIEEIAAGLARRGHIVHVVAPFHRDVRRAPIERGVHLHFFHYSPTKKLNVWGYAESLHADVKLRPRALVAAPFALGAALNTILRLTAQRCPSSNTGESSFDLVHAHWVLPNGVPAAIAARLRKLPLVISLHGSDLFLAERAPPLALTACGTLRAAAAITACSNDLRERALRLGARQEQVKVIPYGVDPNKFYPDPAAGQRLRAELNIPPEVPLILTLSRLVYKKGISYLLEAFPAIHACHPNAVLMIGGYGDLRAELEQRAAELGLAAHIRFPGQIERERTSHYINAADVYVVPSIRDQRGNMDGLPNALLEGMGVGRPIVASRIAGIPEVIDDDTHGLLVPERNPQALAAAINRLLDDHQLAQRLGAAARQRIKQELTWDATAAKFEHVYENIIQQRHTT